MKFPKLATPTDEAEADVLAFMGGDCALRDMSHVVSERAFER
jgi:predicted polyphosphate/ATP-dependent NAD kinase